MSRFADSVYQHSFPQDDPLCSGWNRRDEDQRGALPHQQPERADGDPGTPLYLRNTGAKNVPPRFAKERAEKMELGENPVPLKTYF